MTEPLPSAQADPETPAPTNASDRAAAAALSSLNSTTTAATSDPNANATSSKAPSKEDQDALNEAMSRLEGKEKSTKETEVKTRVKVGKYAEEEERRKKFAGVKVKMEDVAVLVSSWEISTPISLIGTVARTVLI